VAPAGEGTALKRGAASLAVAMIGTLALGGCIASMAAGDTPTGNDRPSPVRRVDPTDARLEVAVVDLVNRHRIAHGLSALVADARIAREARRHSAAMATGAIPFGHDGFPDRIAALRRVMACGAAAENVSSTQGYDDPAPEALRGWLASRGHRGTMEGRYDATGVGVARSPTGKIYFTQIFVER
jgi:uncharacterized protein YkwD